MAWSSAKAAGALRRQSVQEPTPSFIPIDNWGASVHRPQVNAAVLQQPVTSEQGPAGSFERGSTDTIPQADQDCDLDDLIRAEIDYLQEHPSEILDADTIVQLLQDVDLDTANEMWQRFPKAPRQRYRVQLKVLDVHRLEALDSMTNEGIAHTAQKRARGEDVDVAGPALPALGKRVEQEADPVADVDTMQVYPHKVPKT